MIHYWLFSRAMLMLSLRAERESIWHKKMATMYLSTATIYCRLRVCFSPQPFFATLPSSHVTPTPGTEDFDMISPMLSWLICAEDERLHWWDIDLFGWRWRELVFENICRCAYYMDILFYIYIQQYRRDYISGLLPNTVNTPCDDARFFRAPACHNTMIVAAITRPRHRNGRALRFLSELINDLVLCILVRAVGTLFWYIDDFAARTPRRREVPRHEMPLTYQALSFDGRWVSWLLGRFDMSHADAEARYVALI